MAYTVAQLAQLKEQSIGYVFVIEGFPYMWTDTYALQGSGSGSWIDDYGGEAWTVLGGLRMPDSIDEPSLDLDSFMLTGGDMSLTLDDVSGVLIRLLREPEDRDYVAERLAPTDDPAPATMIGIGGLDVDLWGRCIGPEMIGAAGERRRFALPGLPLPGFDHVGVDAAEQTVAFTSITDEPAWLEGRRCAIYRVWQDPITGAYPPLADQIASGYSLTWWGTVPRPNESEAIQFTLELEGAPSWLARTLNQTTPEAWAPASANLGLISTPGQRDDLFAIAFQYISPYTVTDNRKCGFSVFDTTDDVLTTESTPPQIISQLRSRALDLAALAGPEETFSTYRSGQIKINLDGVSIKTENKSPTLAATMQICMHEKVWRFLGYDPLEQDCPYAETETIRDIRFIECTDTYQPWEGAQSPVPSAGYWVGYFTTLPFGLSYTDSDADSNGDWRPYAPLNAAGATALYPEGGQEIALAFGLGPYCAGQLARPVADHVMANGQPCDRTGFVIFRGNYRESLDEDARTVYQIAKVSWADQGGTFADDGVGNRTVYIEKWLDPRLFGHGNPPPDKVWSTENLEWSALSVIGYNTNTVDRADLALLRLLLSTGTKQWDAGSYEDVPGATYTVGANGHPDAVAPHLQGDDQDMADIGCAIPAALVDWTSFIDAAKALPDGGVSSPLNTGKLAYRTGLNSAELIAQICKPRAWGMGLDGYRYGLFSMAQPLDTEDATVAITESDLDSRDLVHVPPVGFASRAAFDRVSIEYGAPAAGEGDPGAQTLEVRALTPRIRVRHGSTAQTMTGAGMTNRALWAGEDNKLAAPYWESAWRALWADTMADSNAAPHELITLPIKVPKANDINTGTVVLVTNAWPATRTGAYGMIGRVGRVVSCSRDRETMTATCQIEVQAGDANTKRRFAPIARVVDSVDTLEERHDAAARKLYCYADAFDHEGGSDVRRFVEPAWSTLGGDALVVGLQYNGREWQPRFTCEVESVDTTAHTITYVDGSFTGVFREREYCVIVLADYDTQTALWPKGLFVVNTDPSGYIGAAKGFELVT